MTLLWLGRVGEADRGRIRPRGSASSTTWSAGWSTCSRRGSVRPVCADAPTTSDACRGGNPAPPARRLLLGSRLLAAHLRRGGVVDEWSRRGLGRAGPLGRPPPIDSAGYPWGDFTDVFDLAVRMLADPASRSPDAGGCRPWLATTRLSGAVGLSGIAAAAAEVAWWKQNNSLATPRRALTGASGPGCRSSTGGSHRYRGRWGIATAAGGDHEEGRRLIARGRDSGAASARRPRALTLWVVGMRDRAGSSGVQAPPDAVIAARTCPMS